MATIPGLYLRGKTYWYAYQVAGKRTFLSLQTGDLGAALGKIEKIRANPAAKTGETVLGLMQAFVDSRRKRNRYTDATGRASLQTLRAFGNYTLGQPVSSIRTATIQTWYDEMLESVAPSTAYTHLNRLRPFFDWCVTPRRILNHNPTAELDVEYVDAGFRLRFCTRAQRDKLIRTCPKTRPDLKFVLFCGFYAGMRKNEIAEARPDWFDLDRGVIHIHKTDTFTPKDREARSVPLAKPFQEFLRHFSMPGKYCIHPELEKGAALYRYDFRRPFNEHMRKQNLAWVTPHVMRKTFASLLASAGVSIYKIAVWMGDEVRTVQKHYASLLPETEDIGRL